MAIGIRQKQHSEFVPLTAINFGATVLLEFAHQAGQTIFEPCKVTEVMELQNANVSISASLTKSKEELASVVTSAAETAKVISCGTGLCRVRVLGKRPLLDKVQSLDTANAVLS